MICVMEAIHLIKVNEIEVKFFIIFIPLEHQI